MAAVIGSCGIRGIMTSQARRIFFDVSGIIAHVSRATTYTGIQRVVTSVLAELAEQENVYLCWGKRRSGVYYCTPINKLTREDLLDPRRFARLFTRSRKGHATSTFPILRKYAADPKKYAFHRARLAVANLLGNERAFVKMGTTRQKWQAWHHSEKKGAKIEGQPFLPLVQPGDQLLILDATWGLQDIAGHYRKAQNAGVQVTYLWHDLIPLVMPNVVVPQLPRLFYQALYDSTAYTTQYAAVSQSTARDLQDFLSAHDVATPVHVVPLAQAKLSLSAPGEEGDTELTWLHSNRYAHVADLDGMTSEIRSLIGTPYVLSVGTLEIRKNNWRLLQAWALLAQTLPPEEVPRLVIAGKNGWMNDDFERFLEVSGHLNGYVTRLEAPSDEELDLLYRHCLFTVMPSLYEGWGLPVGESLSYGRTAVVANNSSLPEVGGDMVHYCDAQSITSIMNACKDLITDPTLRQAYEEQIAKANLRQWRDVAADFMDLANR